MQPYIIVIDTALENAMVALAKGNTLLAALHNQQPNSHASFLHTAIQELLQQQQININQIQAIAVVHGPGSYTGLRVGVASAKGLCFALQIPLITISTLHALAVAAIQPNTNFLIPIIDARRMEVFTAVYNNQLQLVEAPFAVAITNQSFSNYWLQQPVIFVGNAVAKVQTVLQHSNIVFSPATYTPTTLVNLAYSNFLQQQFASTAYAEPLYAKPFYDTKKN